MKFPSKSWQVREWNVELGSYLTGLLGECCKTTHLRRQPPSTLPRTFQALALEVLSPREPLTPRQTRAIYHPRHTFLTWPWFPLKAEWDSFGVKCLILTTSCKVHIVVPLWQVRKARIREAQTMPTTMNWGSGVTSPPHVRSSLYITLQETPPGLSNLY